MSGEITVLTDTVLRVLVVGESGGINAVTDALSTQFDSVSLFRERTVSNALERLTAVDVHCVVCPFNATDDESVVDRIHTRDESLPIVAVADERRATRALEAGATDIVSPDDSPSLIAARIRTAAEREQYRLAATASHSRDRSVLEGSNALILLLDRDGTVTYASPAVESRLGVTPDELEQLELMRFVHPNDHDNARDTVETVSSGPFGTSERATLRLRHADETWRVVELHASNRLEDPHIEGIVVTITAAVPDQSVAKDARNVLDRLDAAVFALGSRWELQYMNDAATALLDSNHQSGTVVWDLLPETVRGEFYERFKEAMETSTVVTFETSHPRVEQSLRVRVHPAESGVTVSARETAAGADETTDRDRLTLLESIVDALEDGVAVLDGSTVTLANTALFDLSEAETLVGRDVEDLFDAELTAAIQERARSPVVRWMDPLSGELVLDEPHPVDVLVAPLPDVDRTLCVVRDRQHSPTGALSTLEEAVTAIHGAESQSAVRQIVVDAARILIDGDLAGLYLVDNTMLRPAAFATQSPPSSVDPPAIDRSVLPIDDISETGISVHDRRSLESFLSQSGIHAEQVVTTSVGGDVLFVTSTDPLAFEPVDLTPLETLVEIAAIALDERAHATHRRAWQRERATLESAIDQVRHLQAVERELFRATTRTQVERQLCEGLSGLETNGGPIEFAWVGTVERTNETITMQEAAGGGEPVSFPLDMSADDPAVRAATTLETTVIEDLADGDDSWRQPALEHGFRSVLSAPLIFDDILYGTITAYADRPDAFNDRTRRAITHLANVGAYTISAIETRHALLSDSSIEVEVVLRDETEPLSSIVHHLEQPIHVQSIMPQSSSGSTVFGIIPDLTADEVRDTPTELEFVESSRSLGDRGNGTLVELVLTEPTVAEVVTEHGGVVQSVTPAGDRTRVIVELANTVDVRSFVQMLKGTYPQTELIARRERDRSVRSGHTFETALWEQLSEQQAQTLETAYYSGFFEWPRRRTGEEVADSLGVSQPTFSRHVRVAQQKLFSLLFEEYTKAE